MKFIIKLLFNTIVRQPKFLAQEEVDTHLRGEIENPIIKAVFTLLDEHIENKHLGSLSQDDTAEQLKWTLGGADALYDFKADVLEKVTRSK